jgi:hypothetical protein
MLLRIKGGILIPYQVITKQQLDEWKDIYKLMFWYYSRGRKASY